MAGYWHSWWGTGTHGGVLALMVGYWHSWWGAGTHGGVLVAVVMQICSLYFMQDFKIKCLALKKVFPIGD